MLVLGACTSDGRRAPVALPAGAATQHLFRLEVETPDERDTLRLTLRLWEPNRFDLAVSDPLGRLAGTLQVAGELGRWRARRGSGSCRFDAHAGVVFDGVALSLPAALLPRLLLGRTPIDPPAQGAWEATGVVEALGSGNERWEIEVRDGAPARWRLEQPGEVTLEWRATPSGGRLEAADGSLVLRWRESAREALTTPPSPLADSDKEPDCGHGTVS